MKIIFVRHAEKETEGENPNLTKKGINQAKWVSRRLQKIKINKFYSSDLNRAKQTAEIISKKIKLKPIIEESLNEFEGKIFKNDKSKWKSIIYLKKK